MHWVCLSVFLKLVCLHYVGTFLNHSIGLFSFSIICFQHRQLKRSISFSPSFPFSLSKYFLFCQILQTHKALENGTHDPLCFISSHIFSLFSFNFFQFNFGPIKTRFQPPSLIPSFIGLFLAVNTYNLCRIVCQLAREHNYRLVNIIP